MRHWLFYACFALLLAVHTPVHAQVWLSDTLTSFDTPEYPIREVTVSNRDEKNNLYINARVVEVTNAGQADESIIPSSDIRVVPESFRLAPAGKRRVRLLLSKQANQVEKVYRVRFLPNIEQIPPSPEIMDTPSQHIQIATGMGLLATVPPKESYADLTWQREDDHILFTNVGTRHMVIAKSTQCAPSMNHACKDYPGERLYAGASWKMALPDVLQLADIRVDVYVGKNKKEVHIPYAAY